MNKDVIAVVAGQEITEADFDTFTKTMPEDQKMYLQDPNAVEFFKKQFVSLYLFAAEGMEEKIDETEECKTILKNMKRDVLAQLVMRNVLKTVTVTDEEAKTYYDNNTEMFQKEETVSARHILMESEEELKGVQEKIAKEEISFEDAAKAHSTCPSGQNGGELGEFGRGQMAAEFEQAAFEAELHKVVGPVKTQFGYHLIKVENHKGAETADFKEVKDQVKATLLQQKQREVVEAKEAELREKYCK